MLIKRDQRPVYIIHTIALVFYTIFFISQGNFEFLAYIAVIVIVMAAILLTNHKLNYPVKLLWGLTIWSILHMSGGGLYINGIRLYDFMVLNLVGAPYHILKMDQIIHAYGFAVATLLMFYLLRPHLGKKITKWGAISVVIILAGMGAGALNEVIEFATTVLFASSGVGGYVNTALDLVFNLVGSVGAMIYIAKTEK